VYNYTTDLGTSSIEDVLEDCSQDRADALLVCSGGLDSAYLLWKYAQEVPKGKIYIHQQKLQATHLPRHYAERNALQAQMDYLGRDFDVFRSTVDIDRDQNICRDWFTAVMMGVYQAYSMGLKYIVTGDCLSSSFIASTDRAVMSDHQKDECYAMRAMVRVISNGEVELVTSHTNTKLADLYHEMPADYFECIMSCRHPLFSNDGTHVRRCDICESCRKNTLFGFADRMPFTMELGEKLPSDYKSDTAIKWG
jgi:7-cyano-7-deazaguanine synthase in queuosine biosynthesis